MTGGGVRLMGKAGEGSIRLLRGGGIGLDVDSNLVGGDGTLKRLGREGALMGSAEKASAIGRVGASSTFGKGERNRGVLATTADDDMAPWAKVVRPKVSGAEL